ncbi:MCE family protein [Rhodococcus sp. USK13]|uniref:MCE family protein n=1 Tax=Rhodococcus sp. USK13 TaxID=2806442 RepID=UPI001BD0B2C6|nr:MCE family protein [Rhodococcus sp. USK13]
MTVTQSRRRKPPYRTAGAVLVASVIGAVVLSLVQFRGGFTSTVPVTVVSDRSGLVMEPGAKVKVHGVVVGSVTHVQDDDGRASLSLALFPASADAIPANVTAQIKSTTVFGAKYVQLDLPDDPLTHKIASGDVIHSTNVTSEVNTLFENLNSVMQHIDPAKLNASLSAVSEALRGKGSQLGETLVNADDYLTKLNPHMENLQQDFSDGARVANNWADAAPEIMSVLDNASATSGTITSQERELNNVLMSAIGFGNTGASLFGDNAQGMKDAARVLVPTTRLLAKYSPQYPCMLNNSVSALEQMKKYMGDNTGYSLDLDVALLPGDDPYTYPKNLPVVAAQGGPGGAPGCYPEITKDMYPAPVLVADTGAGDAVAGATQYKAGSPSFIEYLFGNTVGGAPQP